MGVVVRHSKFEKYYKMLTRKKKIYWYSSSGLQVSDISCSDIYHKKWEYTVFHKCQFDMRVVALGASKKMLYDIDTLW